MNRQVRFSPNRHFDTIGDESASDQPRWYLYINYCIERRKCYAFHLHEMLCILSPFPLLNSTIPFQWKIIWIICQAVHHLSWNERLPAPTSFYDRNLTLVEHGPHSALLTWGLPEPSRQFLLLLRSLPLPVTWSVVSPTIPPTKMSPTHTKPKLERVKRQRRGSYPSVHQYKLSNL